MLRLVKDDQRRSFASFFRHVFDFFSRVFAENVRGVREKLKHVVGQLRRSSSVNDHVADGEDFQQQTIANVIVRRQTESTFGVEDERAAGWVQGAPHAHRARTRGDRSGKNFFASEKHLIQRKRFAVAGVAEDGNRLNLQIVVDVELVEKFLFALHFHLFVFVDELETSSRLVRRLLLFHHRFQEHLLVTREPLRRLFFARPSFRRSMFASVGMLMLVVETQIAEHLVAGRTEEDGAMPSISRAEFAVDFVQLDSVVFVRRVKIGRRTANIAEFCIANSRSSLGKTFHLDRQDVRHMEETATFPFLISTARFGLGSCEEEEEHF